MRRYETIFIADNDLSEEDRSPIFEKLKDLIQQHSGLLVMVDEWGGKKLAYEIKKKARGYYVRLDYCGSGILVNEIERFFRIDDRILKYMTVLLDKDVDIEAVKEEIATAEKAQADETESSKAEPEAKPDVEPEAKLDVEPEAKLDAEPEAKPDAEPEAKPDAEPEAKPDVEPEAKPDVEPDAESNADDESEPETLEK